MNFDSMACVKRFRIKPIVAVQVLKRTIYFGKTPKVSREFQTENPGNLIPSPNMTALPGQDVSSGDLPGDGGDCDPGGSGGNEPASGYCSARDGLRKQTERVFSDYSLMTCRTTQTGYRFSSNACAWKIGESLE